MLGKRLKVLWPQQRLCRLEQNQCRGSCILSLIYIQSSYSNDRKVLHTTRAPRKKWQLEIVLSFLMEAEIQLRVSVVGHIDREGATFFKLRIEIEEEEEWTLERRFSEFTALWHELKHRHSNLPKLPDKSLFHLSGISIEKR